MKKFTVILTILLLGNRMFGQTDVCQSGIDSARVHFSKGILRTYIFGLTESFTFGKILKRDYGIDAIYFGCIVEPKWDCYSNFMNERIKEKFGNDIFEKVATQSRQLDSLGKGDRSSYFPGGEAGLMKFIYCSLDLEKANYTDGRKDKVVLQFTVDTIGHVTDIVVRRSTNQDYSAEAYRVVSLMPNWVPATLNGKPIEQLWNFPILFDKEFKEEHCP